MKICTRCRQEYPQEARYCMICGNVLADMQAGQHGPAGSWSLFWMTLGGSLVLSWLLITVFHLPVFILGAALPLVWFSRPK